MTKLRNRNHTLIAPISFPPIAFLAPSVHNDIIAYKTLLHLLKLLLLLRNFPLFYFIFLLLNLCMDIIIQFLGRTLITIHPHIPCRCIPITPIISLIILLLLLLLNINFDLINPVVESIIVDILAHFGHLIRDNFIHIRIRKMLCNHQIYRQLVYNFLHILAFIPKLFHIFKFFLFVLILNILYK